MPIIQRRDTVRCPSFNLFIIGRLRHTPWIKGLLLLHHAHSAAAHGRHRRRVFLDIDYAGLGGEEHGGY